MYAGVYYPWDIGHDNHIYVCNHVGAHRMRLIDRHLSSQVREKENGGSLCWRPAFAISQIFYIGTMKTVYFDVKTTMKLTIAWVTSTRLPTVGLSYWSR